MTILSQCGSTGSVFPEKEWQTSTPSAQGLDEAKFKEAVVGLGEALKSDRDGISQLFIVRNGFVIHAGDSVRKVHNVFSCTKSFTALTLGLLADDGKCELSTPAHTILPEMKEKYEAVTLRHLITLTSGYKPAGKDAETFVPGEPSFTPPGSKLQYGPWGFALLASSLTKLAGRPMADVFKEKIADPIGMNPDQWSWGTWGKADSTRQDVNGGAGWRKIGVHTNAYELAKLGWLVTNRGVWNGDTLISSDYIEQMTSPQVSKDIPPLEDDGWYSILSGAYGYGCWVNGVQRKDGDRIWPAAPPKTAAIQGNKNNYCFAVPEWNMVIVRLGEHKVIDGAWNGFFKKMSAAIQ